MDKYNQLTKKLLEEGYTADNFPIDKVHIANGTELHWITYMVDLSTTGFIANLLLIRPDAECM